MAVVIQLNPVGMLATDEGYISSISFRSAGGTVVYTPDGTNKIGATGNPVSALAATRLCGGQGVQTPMSGQAMSLVTGS